MLATLKDWLVTFWRVIFVPTPATFRAEAGKASGKFASAADWLVFYAVYLYVATDLVLGPVTLVLLLMAVILVPLAVILFTSAMSFMVRRLAHRKEYVYDKMLYLTVAILVPLQFVFVQAVLALPGTIAFVVSYCLLLYQVTLLTIALKTITNIKYWQALTSVVLAMVATILVCGMVALLIYSTIAAPLVAK